MIVAPPLDDGGDHDTVAEVAPGVALTDNGTVGRVNGVAFMVADALPGPAAFTARRRTEYVVPFDKDDVPSTD